MQNTLKKYIQKVLSILRVFFNEISKDKLALVCLIIFLTTLVTVFVWASILDDNIATTINLFNANNPPSNKHILGTDPGGRDMVQMLVLGARNSLSIAISVTLIGGTIGILLGVVTGYYAGHIDNIIMRIVDTVAMLPTLMIIITIISLLHNYSLFQFTLIMSMFAWINACRTLRSRSLQISKMQYIQASKTLGTPNFVIIFKKVIPNLSSIISSQLTLSLAANIGIETGLTFLGFGLPIGTPSLGSLISIATTPAFIQHRPWQWLPAALFVLIITLCVVFIGQALNKAADVKLRNYNNTYTKK